MPVFELPKHLHPDFARPNVKPKGEIVVDRNNKFGKYLDVALMFYGGTAGAVNATGNELPLYDHASGRFIDATWDYSQFLVKGHDSNGEYIRNTYTSGGVVGGSIDTSKMYLSRCVTNNQYSIVTDIIFTEGTPTTTHTPNIFDTSPGGSAARFGQLAIVSVSASAITFRGINEANWTAGADETFTQTIDEETDYFLAMAYSGGGGVRDIHFDKSVKTNSGFTGAALVDETTGTFTKWLSASLGHALGQRHFFIFNKYFSPALMDELRKDIYQVFKPAVPMTNFTGAAAASGFQPAWAVKRAHILGAGLS